MKIIIFVVVFEYLVVLFQVEVFGFKVSSELEVGRNVQMKRIMVELVD